jgi:hypothetical protein
MFRDESSHVIKKAKAKQRKKASLSPESASSPESDEPSWSKSVTPEPRGKPARLSVLPPSSRSGEFSMPHRIEDDDDNLLPSPDAGSWPSTPMIALMYNLAPTCQERGTAFFFSRYVAIDDTCCHQRFDFVYDIWKPASLAPERQLDGVMASMTAVGLVGVSQLTGSTELMEAARKSYGTALRLTNTALRNPKEAVKDSTLLAILILGLFEMMTEPSPKSMQAWHEHVNGAAALARLRGRGQFRTKAGMRMFMMLCGIVMITCVHKEMPMPQALIDLREGLGPMFGGGQSSVEVNRPIYQILQARYDLRTGKLSNPGDLLGRLKGIEGEFERVIAGFPETWGYKTFRMTKPHPAVYQGICHLYPTAFVATVWNGLRGLRVMLLETILNELSKSFHNVDPDLVDSGAVREYRAIRSKLERLVHAIAASVPQHFGLLDPLSCDLENLIPILTTEITDLPTPPPDSPSSIASSNSPPDYWSVGLEEMTTDDVGPTLDDPMKSKDEQESARRFMLLASTTNTIVWPLFSVGMSSVTPPSMKAYIIDRLMALYNETGLAQAKAVAAIVRNHEVQPSPWARMAAYSAYRSPSPSDDWQSPVVLPM